MSVGCQENRSGKNKTLFSHCWEPFCQHIILKPCDFMPRINDSINFCATCFQCKYHSDITPGVDIAERLLLFVEKLSNLLLNVIAVIICYLLLLVIEMIDFWWNFMGFFCLFFHDCQCLPSSKICNHHVTSLKCFMKSWMCHIAVFVLCASLRSTKNLFNPASGSFVNNASVAASPPLGLNQRWGQSVY